MEGLRFRGRILLSGHGFRSCVQRFHQLSRRPPSEWARSLFFSTTRQTARNAGDYEDAATDFLEKTYADRSGASSGLSTTYGILSFVGFLAVCRTVVKKLHFAKADGCQMSDFSLGFQGSPEFPIG